MDILRAGAILGIYALASMGCTKNSGAEVGTGGQVVARVGNQVLTTLELHNEMRIANVPPEKMKDPVILKRMLDNLALRKYLVEQAQSSKLDQQPNVLLDVMRTREQVLANAFMARKADAVSIDRTDIDKYIAQNPAKFSERRLLNVEQIRFALASNIKDIVEANKAATSLDQIDRSLASMGVQHTRSMAVLNLADLPPEQAQALQARKGDEVFFGRAGNSALYFKVKDEDSRPLEGADAVDYARSVLKAQAVNAQLSSVTAQALHAAVFDKEYAQLMASPEAAKNDAAKPAPAGAAAPPTN